jgi:hypothetical protein
MAKNFKKRLSIVEEIGLEAKNKGPHRMTLRDIIGKSSDTDANAGRSWKIVREIAFT